MYKIILPLVLVIWTFIHFEFLNQNQILKIPDSFAYIQMSYHFKNFSIEWFWTWWFGFLYSLIISIVELFVNLLWLWKYDTLIFAWQTSNIILFLISALILYKISEIYLNKAYRIVLLILFFTSSTLIHYNSNILSENIYIPLFLWLFLFLHRFIESLSTRNKFVTISKNTSIEKNSYKLNTIIVALFIAAMYLTRAESFIYLWSIFLITFYFFLNKEISLKKLIKVNLILIISFFIFISPYIYYLQTITWEWWLTNKWVSNLRQADMRWVEKMDDSWFERAIWELTPDKKHLIAWFAWWLKYDKPNIKSSVKEYLIKEPKKTIWRIIINQKKLYGRNLPKMIIWDLLNVYRDKNFIFYKNKFFLAILLIPLVLIIYWVIKLTFSKTVRTSNKRVFIPLFLSFFIVANLFFTIFFVLDRYFLIFLPLFLIIMVYWTQELFEKTKIRWIKSMIIPSILIYIFSLGSINYYEENKIGDEKVKLKKQAGLWINKNYKQTENTLLNKFNKKIKQKLNIMERFPIVTYYSWTKNRWITPYVDNLKDIITYAKYNKIDLFIVDTMDFKKYRPKLEFLLDENINHKWLSFINKFENHTDKIIIYKID